MTAPVLPDLGESLAGKLQWGGEDIQEGWRSAGLPPSCCPHTIPAMQPLDYTTTKHTDSKSLHNVDAPVYLGAGAGIDADRLERLRSRVAVDSRGRLLDSEMEKHRKSGTRKIDLRAVTPLLLMWLANFIDRTNIGNARIAGLEKDLGLKGLEYNTCLAVCE